MEPRLLRLRAGIEITLHGDGLIRLHAPTGRRLELPDTTSVRDCLHLVEHGVREDRVPQAARLLAALEDAGLVEDVGLEDLLAQARACTRVRIAGSSAWVQAATAVVEAAGLAVTTDSNPDVVLQIDAQPPHEAGAPTESGETPRTDRAPVLHVNLGGPVVRVGPFAQPGHSSCPECLLWHHGGATSTVRGSALPLWRGAQGASPVRAVAEPTARGSRALLHRAALLHAVDDLMAFAEGRAPRSWSAVVWVSSLQSSSVEAVPPHPHCACAWERGELTA